MHGDDARNAVSGGHVNVALGNHNSAAAIDGDNNSDNIDELASKMINPNFSPNSAVTGAESRRMLSRYCG